jgi:hypothetical protein
MLSNVLRTGAASACLLTLGLISTSQSRSAAADPPRVDPPPVVAGQPAAQAVVGSTFRVKQILGSKILIQNNTAVGTVDDIVFDTAGNLEYLIVNNDGKLVTVPWDAAKWDIKNQTGTLAIAPDVFKTIPTYTVTTYPDYWAPAYRTQVYKYYGLTPRELRRLERRIP